MIDLSNAAWRTSSYSGSSQNCVEVAPGETRTAVRDTKDCHGAVLVFPAPAWTTFLSTLRK